jgi:hypothetical protein
MSTAKNRIEKFSVLRMRLQGYHRLFHFSDAFFAFRGEGASD